MRAFHAFFLLILTVYSAPPEIISATFQSHNAQVFGVDLGYTVIELESDQDLYYSENQVCPCRNDSTACQGGTLPPIPQSPDIQLLEQNVWEKADLLWGVERVYKFILEPSDNNPCPILELQANSIYGGVRYFVSNRAIPTAKRYIWTRQGTEVLRICPSDPNYYFGEYYIVLLGPIPYSAVSRYWIKWKQIMNPACAPRLPLGNFRLQNAAEAVGTVNSAEIKYYQYHMDPSIRCSSFAVSIRKTGGPVGELDLVLSAVPENPNPTLFRYDWASALLGDDTITVANYCMPQSSSGPLVFYVGILAYGSFDVGAAAYEYSLVATHNVNFGRYPVTEYGYTGARKLYAAVELFCPVTGEVFRLDYPTYEDCSGDPYQCSYPLFFIAGQEFPNAIWPSNDANSMTYAPILDSLKWNLTDPVINPKKLVLALATRVYSTGLQVYQPLVQSPLDMCTIRFRQKIVNFEGLPITGSVPLTQKVITCDREKFLELDSQLTQLINQMEQSTETETLFRLHLESNFLRASDIWSACTAFAANYSRFDIKALSLPDLQVCRSPLNSPAWKADPCCNHDLELTSCCVPKDELVPVLEFLGAHESKIDEECANAKCIKALSSDTLTTLNNLSTACDTTFFQPILEDSELRFVTTCQESVLGQDLLGRECTVDADCLPGVKCQPNLRCNHTTDDLINCFLTSMGDFLGQALFDVWGLTARATKETLFPQIKNRFVREGCTGPDSMLFQSHWSYEIETETCDPGPSCPIQKCLAPDCTVPPECQAVRFFCPRYFVPGTVKSDCISEFRCNWMDCGTLTQSQCQSACLNPTLSEFVCVSCQGASCTEVPGFDQTQCNNGCATPPCTGSCSLPCSNCDKLKCQGLGLCTGQDTDQEMGSMCYTDPRLDYGRICCGDNCEIETKFGVCLSPYTTRGACIQAGHKWKNHSTKNPCLPAGGCYNPGYVSFSSLSETSCDECGYEQRPLEKWTPAKWTELKKLEWKRRAWIPKRSISNIFDFSLFRVDLEKAKTTYVGLDFSAHEYCYYGLSRRVIRSLTCDCPNKGDGDCFEDLRDLKLRYGRACPYRATNISTRGITVLISEDSFSDTLCQNLGIFFTSSGYFAVKKNTVSSEIFKPTLVNQFTVVYNAHRAFVGQITSGGFTIEFDDTHLDPNSPLMVCLTQTISPSPDFSDIDLGTLVTLGKDNKTKIISPLGQLLTADPFHPGMYCGNITKPGQYFLISRYQDHATRPQHSVRQLVQIWFGAFFYLFCAFGSYLLFVRILMALQDETWRATNGLYFGFAIFVLMFFTTNRAVYFFHLLTGSARDIVVIYFTFELPTFLFISLYSVALMGWMRLAFITSQCIVFDEDKKQQVTTGLNVIFFFFNVFIYCVFLVFFFLNILLPPENDPCELFSNSKRSGLNYSYLVFLAFLAFVLAIAFAVSGLFVVQRIAQIEKESGQDRKSSISLGLTVVCFACSFTIKSGLLLWAAIYEKGDFTVIGFVLLEIVPVIALLFYLWLQLRKAAEAAEKAKGGYNKFSNESSDRDTNSGEIQVNAKPRKQNNDEGGEVVLNLKPKPKDPDVMINLKPRTTTSDEYHKLDD